MKRSIPMMHYANLKLYNPNGNHTCICVSLQFDIKPYKHDILVCPIEK